MKEKILSSKIITCQKEELSEEEQKLIELAKKATDNSYSPYSHFRVGAALRLDDGTEIIGANQENAAFPVTLCAERTAIFAAQAQYPEHAVMQLAIAALNDDGFMPMPTAPCGSCRQVILEVENRYKQPIRLYLYGADVVYVVDSIKDLLPLNFDSDSM